MAHRNNEVGDCGLVLSACAFVEFHHLPFLEKETKLISHRVDSRRPHPYNNVSQNLCYTLFKAFFVQDEFLVDAESILFERERIMILLEPLRIW